MSTIASKLSPPITSMIRMDHTHAVSVYHQYTQYKSPRTRQALAETLCLALEIHAQLEEEIFYPAMQRVELDEPVLRKSVPEHDEMRRLIGKLRASSPHADDYDDTVAELMRDVLHHVADEETTLLPQAERLLGKERLCELGAELDPFNPAPHRRRDDETAAGTGRPEIAEHRQEHGARLFGKPGGDGRPAGRRRLRGQAHGGALDREAMVRNLWLQTLHHRQGVRAQVARCKPRFRAKMKLAQLRERQANIGIRSANSISATSSSASTLTQASTMTFMPLSMRRGLRSKATQIRSSLLLNGSVRWNSDEGNSTMSPTAGAMALTGKSPCRCG